MMILNRFNQAHSNITFEIEKAVNNASISLLDFTLTITTGCVHFQPFVKTAKSDVMLHGGTALPNKMKHNIVRNEWQRIKNRCGEPSNIHNVRKIFKEKLYRNGFDMIPNLNSKYRSVQSNTTKPFYLSIPFISDEYDTRIRRALRTLNVPIRIVHKGKALQNILNKSNAFAPTRSGKCEMPGCPINSHLCYKKLIVYKCVRKRCGQFYIGSTHEHALCYVNVYRLF